MTSRSNNSAPARIMIVDDHDIIRHGIIRVIENQTDMVVCGYTDNGGSLLKLMRELKPDIVLMDIELQEYDGLKLTRMIRSHYPKIHVIMLSMYPESSHGVTALHCGASGYVAKEEVVTTLVSAIREVQKGNLFFCEQVKNHALRTLSGCRKRAGPMIDLLSDRERQVFSLIGKAYTSKMIADRLSVSIKTIETHRSRIKVKLDLDTSPALVLAAGSWLGTNGSLRPSMQQ